MLTLALISRWASLIEVRIFENPNHTKDLGSRNGQDAALILALMELAIMLSIIFACIIYSVIRILIGRKLTYPKAYASNKNADFILENLGEIEMFCTILSPALSGIGLTIFWLIYDDYKE